MVVVRAWKSSSEKSTNLLKTICNLTQNLLSENGISFDDIGVIIHAGVYRRNFRTEPAFATHIQGDLKLKCGPVSQESHHCFSFDVSDGSCSPYVALNVASHMLRIKPEKYCLITIGDERPNKQSNWPYQPITCVMLVALEGDGYQLTGTNFDSSAFDSSTYVEMIFDSAKSANVIGESSSAAKINTDKSKFSGDTNWLSGRHIHAFLSQFTEGTTNTHEIIDQSGKTVTATWV